MYLMLHTSESTGQATLGKITVMVLVLVLVAGTVYVLLPRQHPQSTQQAQPAQLGQRAQSAQPAQQREEPAQSVQPQASPQLPIVHIDASWAENYDSIASLKGGSHIVVVGIVNKQIKAYKDSHGLPFSDFSVDIQQVVANPAKLTVGSDVIVHQTGGVVDNQLYQIDDDPLLNPGEHVVLFLHQYEPGQFRIVGGPQGRFVVESGQARPISSYHVRSVAGPVPLDQFLASIK
jgi:hypothetical protein